MRIAPLWGQGHGRFWEWDKENGLVWLFGAARVTVNLEVPKLSGKPVLLLVTAVTISIGDFKARLYRAWHSGRKTNYPISREVKKNITGISVRTQRHYCQVTKIKRTSNIAIGRKFTKEEAEKQAWQRGRAIFEFTDQKGKLV